MERNQILFKPKKRLSDRRYRSNVGRDTGRSNFIKSLLSIIRFSFVFHLQESSKNDSHTLLAVIFLSFPPSLGFTLFKSNFVTGHFFFHSLFSPSMFCLIMKTHAFCITAVDSFRKYSQCLSKDFQF